MRVSKHSAFALGVLVLLAATALSVGRDAEWWRGASRSAQVRPQASPAELDDVTLATVTPGSRRALSQAPAFMGDREAFLTAVRTIESQHAFSREQLLQLHRWAANWGLGSTPEVTRGLPPAGDRLELIEWHSLPTHVSMVVSLLALGDEDHLVKRHARDGVVAGLGFEPVLVAGALQFLSLGRDYPGATLAVLEALALYGLVPERFSSSLKHILMDRDRGDQLRNLALRVLDKTENTTVTLDVLRAAAGEGAQAPFVASTAARIWLRTDPGSREPQEIILSLVGAFDPASRIAGLQGLREAGPWMKGRWPLVLGCLGDDRELPDFAPSAGPENGTVAELAAEILVSAHEPDRPGLEAMYSPLTGVPRLHLALAQLQRGSATKDAASLMQSYLARECQKGFEEVGPRAGTSLVRAVLRAIPLLPAGQRTELAPDIVAHWLPDPLLGDHAAYALVSLWPDSNQVCRRVLASQSWRSIGRLLAAVEERADARESLREVTLSHSRASDVPQEVRDEMVRVATGGR